MHISDYHGPLLGSPFTVLIFLRTITLNDLPVIESSGIRDSKCNEETKFLIRSKDPGIDVQINGLNFILFYLKF